jgi:hypothetical protein
MGHLIAILAFLFASMAAVHAETEVTLGLSSPRTQVGAPVEMVLTVRGTRSAELPASIRVDGLEINAIGRQQRFEMRNFQTTSSVVYTYRIQPLREGDFTIPPVEVKVGDASLFSNAVTLQVAALPAPLPGGSAGPSTGAVDDMSPFFGEIVLSRREAYVGEVIPAELRFYFSAELGGEVGDRPEFGGEGFTVQDFASMPKREQIVNGAKFVLFTFQTAITPVKSGSLEVPEAKLGANLQIPGSRPPGMDDFFRNFGGGDPFGMFTQSRRVEVVAPPTGLEVKPLPSAGKPTSFSGAIGRFSMDVAVEPSRVKPGEPVTMRVTVSGQGNLDAMGAPVLRDDAGWRTYDPVARVESRDAVNYSGSKIYEFMMIALEDQERTPGVAFGFFDPAAGEYRELVADPLPVDAPAGDRQQVAADTAAPEAEPPPLTTPVAAATPMPAVGSGGSSTWTPWLGRTWVLVSGGAIAAFALAWCGFLGVRAFLGSAFLRAAGRRRRLERLLENARRAPDDGFVVAAAAVLEGVPGGDPGALDLESRLEAFAAAEEVKVPLRGLLGRLAEVRYGGGGLPPPEASERKAVLEVLGHLVKESNNG